jgi:hypothetical protein
VAACSAAVPTAEKFGFPDEMAAIALYATVAWNASLAEGDSLSTSLNTGASLSL